MHVEPLLLGAVAELDPGGSLSFSSDMLLDIRGGDPGEAGAEFVVPCSR